MKAVVFCFLFILFLAVPLKTANPEPTEDWIKLHKSWQGFLSNYCQCSVPMPDVCYCKPAQTLDINEYLKIRRLAAKVFEFKECK